VLSAAFLLLTGVSAWSVSLAILLPLLLYAGVPATPVELTAAVVAALAAATGGGPTGEALVAVSSLLALAGSVSLARRLLLTAPILVLLLSGSMHMLPLVAAGAASATPGRPSRRWTMITAGAIACLALNGLPGVNREALPVTARCVARGTGAVWPDTITLDHSRPVLRLDFSAVAGSEVQMRVSAGGVRRHETVGLLELPGAAAALILPGDTILTFPAPDGAATLVLSMGWKPFNHPVLRFCGATAAGGPP
jgi:hypothetical protein